MQAKVDADALVLVGMMAPTVVGVRDVGTAPASVVGVPPRMPAAVVGTNVIVAVGGGRGVLVGGIGVLVGMAAAVCVSIS